MALAPIRPTIATLPRRAITAAPARVQPPVVQASAPPPQVNQASDGFFHRLAQIPRGTKAAIAGAGIEGLAVGLMGLLGPTATAIGMAAGVAVFALGVGLTLGDN